MFSSHVIQMSSKPHFTDIHTTCENPFQEAVRAPVTKDKNISLVFPFAKYKEAKGFTWKVNRPNSSVWRLALYISLICHLKVPLCWPAPLEERLSRANYAQHTFTQLPLG